VVLYTSLKFKVNMYKMNEEREIKPKTLSAMISTMMYEKRYVPLHAILIDWIFV
jgi:20S proteasome alpha/beta subunit